MNRNDYPDNHDSRLRYYHLVLEKKILDDIPEYPLPSGFHFTCYQDGDMEDWIAIEKSAKEFRTVEEGVDAWGRYYLHREQELHNRMFFIETEQEEKVATATAFYDPSKGDLRNEAGWLHWVAVKREYQGLGLARPLISKALRRLVELGYPSLKLSSQTNTWVAVKIYMDFGFVPEPENAVHSREGYEILKALTNHPTLDAFDNIPFEHIWNRD